MWLQKGKGEFGCKEEKVLKRYSRTFENARVCSRMFGEVRGSSENFLWTARAATVEGCPAGVGVVTIHLILTQPVRGHAATARGGCWDLEAPWLMFVMVWWVFEQVFTSSSKALHRLPTWQSVCPI